MERGGGGEGRERERERGRERGGGRDPYLSTKMAVHGRHLRGPFQRCLRLIPLLSTGSLPMEPWPAS